MSELKRSDVGAAPAQLWQEGGTGAFLRELIDDASLFPPAMLPMADAVTQHLEHRRGQYSWVLGRFVCPASRLQELLSAMPSEGLPWRLSVIVDLSVQSPWTTSLAEAMAEVSRFRESGRGVIESLEGRLPAGIGAGEFARALVEAGGELAPGARLFVELPFGGDWEANIPRALEEIAGLGAAAAGAKVRCGGSRAQDFPSAVQLARFIACCARLGVPFKATAGLHHPLPHPDPVLNIRQHGFLNVIGGALLAVGGQVDEGGLVALLEDDAPNSFRLDHDGFSWRGHRLTPEEIERGRRLVTCFGSCSFLEPMEGLVALLRAS
ncbi:MAG: hypothetical protein NZ695_00715 [Dehalococcoidia bacterium]|nr:hypothetical protein [Dehalococcoidia bacterium]MDW8008096.1 hypothetical protein [Chloroflexota bacterium]